MKYLVCTVAVGALLAASTVSAKQIGSFKDWSAHADGKGKARTCWIYSEPVKDEGKYKRRGRIYALVTHMPGDKITNQVQFTAGYTFKKGSAVRVAIGKRTFQLFINADTAWARNKKDDAALVRAMRAGSRMTVTGTSSRGTKTKDTYSLSSISAAYNAIGKACKVK